MTDISIKGSMHLIFGLVVKDADGNITKRSPSADILYNAGMKYNLIKGNAMIGSGGSKKLYINLSEVSGILLFFKDKYHKRISSYYEVYEKLNSLDEQNIRKVEEIAQGCNKIIVQYRSKINKDIAKNKLYLRKNIIKWLESLGFSLTFKDEGTMRPIIIGVK